MLRGGVVSLGAPSTTASTPTIRTGTAWVSFGVRYAWSMQNRVAGMASSRAGAIAFWHTSHRP